MRAKTEKMRRIFIILIVLFLNINSKSEPFVLTEVDSFGSTRIKLNEYFWRNTTNDHWTIGKKGYFNLPVPVRDSLLLDAKYRLAMYEKRIINP